jgi:flavin reductase (DIM6/NTAB) family NADH-FMN oxidoreductase RutF
MDRATFFAVMGAFPTGVAVVTAMDATQEPRGLTTNALCSVSAEPPLMLVCVDKNSNTLPALRHSQKFVVNYLAASRGELANVFASKEPDKFAHVSWRPAQNGMPFLPADSIAHAECNVVQEIEAGDHFILIGQVEYGQPPAPGTKPLIYFRRSYGTWDGE